MIEKAHQIGDMQQSEIISYWGKQLYYFSRTGTWVGLRLGGFPQVQMYSSGPPRLEL